MSGIKEEKQREDFEEKSPDFGGNIENGKVSKTKSEVTLPNIPSSVELTVHDVKQGTTSIDMDNKIDQAITQFYIQKEEENNTRQDSQVTFGETNAREILS